MPLYSLIEKDLRDHCKRAIEALEQWMRRLIDQKLTESYGANYLDATRPNGDRVINKSIATTLAARMAQEPDRYPTLISAALLEDEISLLCNPELYKEHFIDALKGAFPLGNEEARTFLERLIPSRNALSHANTISVHDAYRVLCYSHDVIQSIKDYYKAVNMGREFNVPTIIRVTDSLGHDRPLSDPNRTAAAALDFSRDDKHVLRCGDTLSIEIEVDPTFDASTYEIKWQIANTNNPTVQHGPKFVLPLEEHHVAARFSVVCHVTSNAKWHKLGTHDDQIDIDYCVLPP